MRVERERDIELFHAGGEGKKRQAHRADAGPLREKERLGKTRSRQWREKEKKKKEDAGNSISQEWQKGGGERNGEFLISSGKNKKDLQKDREVHHGKERKRKKKTRAL